MLSASITAPVWLARQSLCTSDPRPSLMSIPPFPIFRAESSRDFWRGICGFKIALLAHFSHPSATLDRDNPSVAALQEPRGPEHQTRSPGWPPFFRKRLLREFALPIPIENSAR